MLCQVWQLVCNKNDRSYLDQSLPTQNRF